ncbi:uroporphyrinogen decarboxylase family protein [Candidatus Formimonas warabiya]|uniref:Uroporphyrinogen decarboxylase (URO-D) domain-containing protein n=1 Tax=Formimonas warabiya TaxID=1761012 RepID=A0A3G1KQK9_FORW1|nr:uroporphyrinogen decarboxylase family protein [Candidatus Formimonas warabiya]ATW24744.1 hypothetical protein DCMF_08115 [Candidatus Formimonas warabiya]
MSRAGLYQERLNRIETAARCGIPDRIPVILFIDLFTPRYLGMKTTDLTGDIEKGANILADVAEELQVDGVHTPAPFTPLAFAAGWPARILLPGRDVGEYEIIQFDESKPLMTLDDYDGIINKGWRQFESEFRTRHIDFLPPDQIGPELKRYTEERDRAVERLKERGIVTFSNASSVKPTFEFLAAARTIPEFFKDLYRYPQKVLDAMDAALPDLIENTLASAKASAQATGANRIRIGCTRGGQNFISLAKFEKFYWHYLKQMVHAFVEAGFQVLFHLDQDFTANLPYFKELPPGKVTIELDGFTDIFKAKEILHDHTAIKGDVHPSLLTLGKPEEVDAYCKKLFAEVGKGGGFLLAEGCCVPPDAKIENIRAMVNAIQKYGAY